jgi:hypothetical protein
MPGTLCASALHGPLPLSPYLLAQMYPAPCDRQGPADGLPYGEEKLIPDKTRAVHWDELNLMTGESAYGGPEGRDPRIRMSTRRVALSFQSSLGPKNVTPTIARI